MKKKFYILLLILFVVACSGGETKVYKVEYRGNYPIGTFKMMIGNDTIFTNADVLEVYVKRNPKFFCYSVNKEVLCNFNFDVKINKNAARRFVDVTQNLKEINSRSGKNRTILSERLNYYLNGNKLEEEDVLIATELKGDLIYEFAVPITGKGPTEEESKEGALKKSDELVKVLIDKR